jgi:hypothetical protein
VQRFRVSESNPYACLHRRRLLNAFVLALERFEVSSCSRVSLWSITFRNLGTRSRDDLAAAGLDVLDPDEAVTDVGNRPTEPTLRAQWRPELPGGATVRLSDPGRMPVPGRSARKRKARLTSASSRKQVAAGAEPTGTGDAR